MTTSGSANLRVRISADLADLKQGMALMRGEFAQLKKQAAQAAPDANKWTAGLKQIRTQIAGVVSAYAILRGVRTYLDLADQANNLSARLRLATKSQQEFSRAYQGTYAIAQSTSAEWESVVNLYAQLAQTTGMAQAPLLALTKTISQSFQVSGASAQETANGLRQLQQAMAGGVLRAEEFNTIIETSPRIVQALADHFGIAFGQVRKHVNDGKITSQEFAVALQKASTDIEADFNKLPLTVARATQQVRNALLQLVGDTDKATTASGDLARGIADLARTLESPEVQQGFATFVTGITTAIGALVKLLATTSSVTRFMAEELAARLHGASADDTVRVEQRIERLQKTMKSVEDAPSTGGLSLLKASELIPEDLISKRATVLTRLQGELDKENAKLALGNELREAAARLEQLREPSDPAAPVTSPVTPEGGTTKAIAASNALLRDSVARALVELDRLYEGHEIGIADYFAARQGLQEKAIDADIEQARAELAVTKEVGARRKIEEDIIKLQRDRAEVGVAGAREQQKAEDELTKQLGDVKVKLLELDGESGRAARIQLETEYMELFKRLDAASDETGRKMVENLIDRLVSKAQLDQIKNAASEITGALQGTETSVEAQMQVGMLGQLEGERQLQAARELALQKLFAMRQAAVDSLAALAPGSPEHTAALAGIQGLDTNIANITASMQKYRMQIQDAAVNSVTNLFMDLVEGSKSAGEALRDFVRGFALFMAQIAARALATLLVLKMLDAIYPGLGKATAAGMSVGAAHNGGVAGKFTMTRHNINPMVFGAAPRYHEGGVAGLRPGEVPAILMEGERIRTEQQEASLQRELAAGKSGTVTTPIVAIGDAAVADALASAAGENVVLTHVRNNWEALSRG